MLLVKTVVKESPIHGLGLFAEEFIAAGQTIWRLDPVLDRVIPEAELARMPPHVVEFLDVYAEHYPELSLLVLSGDNDRFTNHSATPNTDMVRPLGPAAEVRATRDIHPGEEITCDYTVVRSRAYTRLLSILPEVAANLPEGPELATG